MVNKPVSNSIHLAAGYEISPLRLLGVLNNFCCIKQRQITKTVLNQVTKHCFVKLALLICLKHFLLEKSIADTMPMQ